MLTGISHTADRAASAAQKYLGSAVGAISAEERAWRARQIKEKATPPSSARDGVGDDMPLEPPLPPKVAVALRWYWQLPSRSFVAFDRSYPDSLSKGRLVSREELGDVMGELNSLAAAHSMQLGSLVWDVVVPMVTLVVWLCVLLVVVPPSPLQAGAHHHHPGPGDDAAEAALARRAAVAQAARVLLITVFALSSHGPAVSLALAAFGEDFTRGNKGGVEAMNAWLETAVNPRYVGRRVRFVVKEQGPDGEFVRRQRPGGADRSSSESGADDHHRDGLTDLTRWGRSRRRLFGWVAAMCPGTRGGAGDGNSAPAGGGCCSNGGGSSYSLWAFSFGRPTTSATVDIFDRGVRGTTAVSDSECIEVCGATEADSFGIELPSRQKPNPAYSAPAAFGATTVVVPVLPPPQPGSGTAPRSPAPLTRGRSFLDSARRTFGSMSDDAAAQFEFLTTWAVDSAATVASALPSAIADEPEDSDAVAVTLREHLGRPLLSPSQVRSAAESHASRVLNADTPLPGVAPRPTSTRRRVAASTEESF